MSTHITVCARCKRLLQPADRVVTAAIAPSRARMRRADEAGNVMLALGDADFELQHVDCEDPRLGRMSMEIRRSMPLDRCGRCRLAVQAADRVVTCFIVQHTGLDPNKPLDLQTCLNADVEIVHADCRDPQLTGRLASELRLPPVPSGGAS